MLGGLGVSDMQWSGGRRELLLQHWNRYGLKSAFSEVIGIQPDNPYGASVGHWDTHLRSMV
jgi:hypothetical protein